jgi:hypothetical protein
MYLYFFLYNLGFDIHLSLLYNVCEVGLFIVMKCCDATGLVYSMVICMTSVLSFLLFCQEEERKPEQEVRAVKEEY